MLNIDIYICVYAITCFVVVQDLNLCNTCVSIMWDLTLKSMLCEFVIFESPFLFFSAETLRSVSLIKIKIIYIYI